MKKVALVTGGSRGIGYGISSCLANEGYDIVIVGTKRECEVSEKIDSLRKAGVELLYCQADISETKDRKRIIEDTMRKFGKLNLLVNNAGVAPMSRADILETSEESYERVMKINLQGPYFLSQIVANYMIEQREKDENFSGCIINISSISATVASVNRGEYCISKAGLGMLTKLFAVRMAEFKIPVYEIRPGIIVTDMTAGVKGKYDKLMAEGILLQKRWGTPEDVGRVVAMMARGDIAYSTGQVVNVDGGFNVERL
ncbi:MAG TPA: 3-ketoacyl-ACP reductase [Victivallales bacterium]|nr:3-ketoacyl-ACP reductase [Victivallales bacterium]